MPSPGRAADFHLGAQTLGQATRRQKNVLKPALPGAYQLAATFGVCVIMPDICDPSKCHKNIRPERFFWRQLRTMLV
jgi:hypothetical protein